MKKTICFLMTICLLFGCVFIACAESIDLTKLKTRENFLYLDGENTEWLYYQYAEKTIADGTYIEFLVADWGNNTEASGYPELRVFATTKNNEDIIVQSASFLIDGNLFELTFAELELDDNHGACFYMTSEAIPFVRSLATAQNISAVLRHNLGTTSVTFTQSEFAPVAMFARDLLDIDFLNHIVRTESSYERWYTEKTPIVSYVFNQDAIAEQSEQEQQPIADDNWKTYLLHDLGLSISLPSNYITYTRGMDADDPALAVLGMTSAEVDQLLADGYFYLEASPDDNFNSEVIVTMTGTTLEDFSTWSDGGLLDMTSLWTTTYAAYGLEIMDTDIFSCNEAKYIRMHERDTTADSIAYRIQYYTIKNNQAINLIYVSVNDDVTESEKIFMQEVVERAVFESDVLTSDISAFAQDAANFTYTVLENGEACITGYNGWTSTVAIPEVIDGYPVSSLAMMEKNSFVTNVYIPDSITMIDGNPFADWESLKTITVSETHPCFSTEDGVLYTRDDSTLLSYPSKHTGEDFSVPPFVTKIGKEAFGGACTLTQITLPEGLTEIGDAAFAGLYSVSFITIPSTVTSIGSNPFCGMNNLEKISVASGNKTFTIEQGALYNTETNTLVAFPCQYVTSSFSFRDGITSIGDCAFWNNDSVLNIVFPSTITYIGDSAFYACGNMTFSDLPANLQTIGDSAFMLAGITAVTLPATIQSIGRACFAGSNLKEVIIMPGVTEISPVMFNDSKITKITLPETVEKIGEYAFVNCKELAEVYIPSSVVSMGEGVFENCPNVKVLVVKGSYGEMYCKQNDIPYQYQGIL